MNEHSIHISTIEERIQIIIFKKFDSNCNHFDKTHFDQTETDPMHCLYSKYRLKK